MNNRSGIRVPSVCQMAANLRTGTMKNADENVYEFPYIKPPELGWFESLKKEMWNPETRQVMGRTGKSWGKLMYCKLTPYSVKPFTLLVASSVE